jgi:hypothetical protein
LITLSLQVAVVAVVVVAITEQAAAAELVDLELQPLYL